MHINNARCKLRDDTRQLCNRVTTRPGEVMPFSRNRIIFRSARESRSDLFDRGRRVASSAVLSRKRIRREGFGAKSGGKIYWKLVCDGAGRDSGFVFRGGSFDLWSCGSLDSSSDLNTFRDEESVVKDILYFGYYVWVYLMSSAIEIVGNSFYKAKGIEKLL